MGDDQKRNDGPDLAAAPPNDGGFEHLSDSNPVDLDNTVATFFVPGTGYTTSQQTKKNGNHSFDALRSDWLRDNVPSMPTYTYDGCDQQNSRLLNSGITAHGTDEVADQIIEDLQKQLDKVDENTTISATLFGHSRGCISILKAIEKIETNPTCDKLKGRILLDLDLNEITPGNIRAAARLNPHNSSWVLNKISDLSQCKFVKKVNITLSTSVEKNKKLLPFAPLIPRFHPDTQCNTHLLPMTHSGQERHPEESESNYNLKLAIYNLGICTRKQKILERLSNNKGKITNKNELEEEELKYYKKILRKSKKIKKGDRNVHFDATITAYQGNVADITHLNLRHYHLEKKLGSGNSNQERDSQFPEKIVFAWNLSPPDNVPIEQFLKQFQDINENGASNYLSNYKKLDGLLTEINSEIQSLKEKNGATKELNSECKLAAESAEAFKQALAKELYTRITRSKNAKPDEIETDYYYRTLQELKGDLESLNNTDTTENTLMRLQRHQQNLEKNAKMPAKITAAGASFYKASKILLLGILALTLVLLFFPTFLILKDIYTQPAGSHSKKLGPNPSASPRLFKSKTQKSKELFAPLKTNPGQGR